MDELRPRNNAELTLVATSRNYGRSTRDAARKLLAERGVNVDPVMFAHPSAGDVPARPPGGMTVLAILLRVTLGFVLVVIAMSMRR